MSNRLEDTSQSDDLHNPLPRQNERKRRLDTLSEEDKKALARLKISEEWLGKAEQEIQELLRIKGEKGNLYGTPAVEEAAQRLGRDRSTIYRMMKRYEQEQNVNALIPRKRGANPGQRLTTEQQLVICALHLNPIPIKVGAIMMTPGRSTVTYIHEVLRAFYPPSVSNDTVARFIEGLKKEHGLMVDMARRGEAYIRDYRMPTPAFNVERPNQIWQLDARPLPIYVRHQGVITTPSLLLVVDQKSHYPIRARLIPRVELSTNGRVKRADVRNEDVGILLASAIYHLGIRPEKLYTDNGSSIIGVGDMLASLLGEGELLTQFTRSIPGRPRGRGVVERMLQEFDQLLVDLLGNMVPDHTDPKKKDHYTLIHTAKNDPNVLELAGEQGLQGHIDFFMNVLRDKPPRANGKETRRELWTETGALSAFPIRELMRLLPKDRQVSRDAAIDKWQITFEQKEHGGGFEPRLDSEQDWDKWLIAASRPERIPLRAMNIDTGWKIEVCLDRNPSEPYWCELILKDRQMIQPDYRMEQINRSLQRIREQYAAVSDTLRAAAEEIGLTTIVKVPGSGPVRLGAEPSSTPAAPPPDVPSPPRSSVSVRTSQPEPPPKSRKRRRDIASLVRRVEEERKEGNDAGANREDCS